VVVVVVVLPCCRFVAYPFDFAAYYGDMPKTLVLQSAHPLAAEDAFLTLDFDEAALEGCNGAEIEFDASTALGPGEFVHIYRDELRARRCGPTQP
jgi:hypothetical protein